MSSAGFIAVNVRYGPRSDEVRAELARRRAQAPAVWSQAVNAVWETDPDRVAAVLPRPLSPSERPFVRATITRVDMGGSLGTFGAGYFGVAAVHDGVEGEYPLLMPMTNERAVTGGRETFGEPKKMGYVDVSVSEDSNSALVRAVMGRMGVDLVEVTGILGEPIDPPPERTKLDFYFKFLPSPDGKGFDDEPSLVHCTKVEAIRLLRPVSGSVTLRESVFDPVADLPVLRLVELTWQERSTHQSGEVVTRVPAEWILPFVHQRYDDPLPAELVQPGNG